MSTQPSEAIPSVDTTFGACYIGTIIAAILFGISNLQTVIYYKRYPNDWWVYRYSVAILWILDTLHVALSTHALYFYLITMFGDLIGGLESGLWTMKLQLSLNLDGTFTKFFHRLSFWPSPPHLELPYASITFFMGPYFNDEKFTDLAYEIPHDVLLSAQEQEGHNVHLGWLQGKSSIRDPRNMRVIDLQVG
ncbi:hypothetical protein EDD18DRAFT_1337885 [Armillaria luteobubalina]|uniref:Uncharacterized protein n=1 Tax=Armillaria luteobubalina TaxID=153913 RepID=A0AA39P4N1_9AGAR|nr:hypothetical protein EDD18DRAFT_1337885 [Armillaria luteobubalina]